MICLLFLWDLWFELANACPPVTNNDWKRKLEWFSLCLHNNPQRTLLWLNICVWGLSPPFPADRQFSSKFSSKQTPIIGATHNPTNVLEFLHNQPAWLFDLVDECSMDNTTYVKEEDYYCLPFDVDSTFSQSFGTKGFSIQDLILLFFFPSSSWKYQVSSSFFHPRNHIALLNFSQKVRVNVKSPVFLFISQNAWHGLYNSFVSGQFFLYNACSMVLKHQKRCPASL